MKYRTHENRLSQAFLLVASLFVVIPLIFVFNTSLKTELDWLRQPLSPAWPPHIRNYLVSWEKARILLLLQNSLLYSVSSAFGTCTLGLLAAYPLSRKHIRASNAIYILFLLGLFLPAGLVPTIFVMKLFSLLNTRIGYIILSISYNLPFAIFVFTGFIRAIPQELDEAATMDGCGYLRFIIIILAPLMRPSIATVALFTVINVWNDFINPLIYLVDTDVRPLTSGLFIFQGQYSTEWTLLSAAVIIIATPLMLLFLFAQSFIVDGLTAGALK